MSEKLLRGLLINPKAEMLLAGDEAITFNGVTYMPRGDLAYFMYIMCHSLPYFNGKNVGLTARTLAKSAHTAKDQLLNFRHMIAENYPELRDDKIIGHIKDVYVPTKEWIAAGMLTDELDPTPEMTEGMPVYALGCLYKRAKGVKRLIAEHVDGKSKWATSMEASYFWPSTAVEYDGKITPLVQASDELILAVIPDPKTGAEPSYSYAGKPVRVIPGHETDEIEFVGGALTMYPADSKADIVRMVASFDNVDDGYINAESRKNLPDSAFIYVEDTGTKDDNGRTVSDSARHCPVFGSDGSVDVPRLHNALEGFSKIRAATDTISTEELRRKLIKKLLPLAKKHFPDGDFVIQNTNKSTTKGGVRMSDDILKSLQGLKQSLDELESTDGFQSFKEANAKVKASRDAVYAIMDKCSTMLSTMAEAKAAELVKDGGEYVAKAEYDKVVVDAAKATETALAEAKKEWETELAEKDRVATVVADRMKKLEDAKIGDIPESLKASIDAIPADEEGDAKFNTLISRLEVRKEACTKAGVEVSDNIRNRILSGLDEDDDKFQADLDIWASLSKKPKPDKTTASHDKLTFIPSQPSGEPKSDKPLGIC